MYAMYDSLVRVTPKGEIIPWLSALPTVSADGKSYTFKLRTDVKYHDGTTFDAESVKWNLDRYRLTKESLRLGELAPVDTVTVVDPGHRSGRPEDPVRAVPVGPRRPLRHDAVAEDRRGRRRGLHPQGVQGG